VKYLALIVVLGKTIGDVILHLSKVLFGTTGPFSIRWTAETPPPRGVWRSISSSAGNGAQLSIFEQLAFIDCDDPMRFGSLRMGFRQSNEGVHTGSARSCYPRPCGEIPYIIGPERQSIKKTPFLLTFCIPIFMMPLG